ncbi:MAG: ABC transporter ATP-binding protein [Actinobacteria bacterium]|nr:ABC transporter ATP-binding protein [Actinomycetota bacterium]
MKAQVTLENVAKCYTKGTMEIRALDGVSIDVKRGEFVSIMGASGSGKSTLLHLIGALDRSTAGEIYLEGKALSSLSDDALSDIRRERIGFIFQQFNLLPTLTSFENAALPTLLAGRARREDRERVREMLAAVGMGDRLDHKPEELSGGQMQRVAIARALSMQPAIILADEPTGNLDSKMGEETLAILKECQESYGQTIIMVTHDAKAAAYGDRIITLKDGKVVEELEAI